jgi:hypothetical protein
MITQKLHSVVTETDKTRFLKELNKKEVECNFWKDIVRNNMPDKIEEYYKELDLKLKPKI